ncbi:hypothetical protein RFI_30329 [Reticulomyxa filosa]|uniref:Viral A-type inclusion protein n=1 Tax=Reticulomyxa filosa TaxID=46433 RepID=X6LZM2_RETFI|nr:hypothetical protein RFI_30329 [Reticulomyxa filosa]|eukprot:ETO07064.1 hypothetical protein RFI_30329 [Reticulomyxa filosa]
MAMSLFFYFLMKCLDILMTSFLERKCSTISKHSDNESSPPINSTSKNLKDKFVAMSSKQKELYNKTKVIMYFHLKSELPSKEEILTQPPLKKSDEKGVKERRKNLPECLEQELVDWNPKKETESNDKETAITITEDGDRKASRNAMSQTKELESEIKKLQNENKKILQLAESLQAVSDASREVAKTAMKQEQQLIQCKQMLDLKIKQLHFYRQTAKPNAFHRSVPQKFFQKYFLKNIFVHFFC